MLLTNGTDNNGKDLLTNRKDPWAESKDFKGLFIENSISKYLKGSTRTLGTLSTEIATSANAVAMCSAHASGDREILDVLRPVNREGSYPAKQNVFLPRVKSLIH